VNINVDVDIDSPKSKVWSVVTDIKNCHNVVSAITKLDILHQPDNGLVGLKWAETRKIFGQEAEEVMWITECADGDYYCTRAENHGAAYITEVKVREIDEKTRLSMSFTGSSDSITANMLSAVMGVFIKKPMIKMLQQDLDEIKSYVEKTA